MMHLRPADLQYMMHVLRSVHSVVKMWVSLGVADKKPYMYHHTYIMYVCRVSFISSVELQKPVLLYGHGRTCIVCMYIHMYFNLYHVHT